MVTVARLRPDHFTPMISRLQPWQADMAPYLSDLGWRRAMADGDAWTLLEENVIPVASAGVYEIWPNRAFAWAILTRDCGPYLLRFTREIIAFLDRCPYRRVETYVLDGFENGVKWMKTLGFKVEGQARAYTPEGFDVLLYARVR